MTERCTGSARCTDADRFLELQRFFHQMQKNNKSWAECTGPYSELIVACGVVDFEVDISTLSSSMV